MRFQQLKHDPNNIVRKKLIKSKKNWIVVSSLSLVGGLFLFGAPSVTVDAATPSTDTQTQVHSADFTIPADSVSGSYGNTSATDSKWYISDNTLHIGPGTFVDNNTTSSPWANYSDDIDAISFDGNVIGASNMQYMFANLKNLKTIDNYKSLDLSQTTSIKGLFQNDSSISDLDLSGWNVTSVNNMMNVFYGDTALKSVSIANWNPANVLFLDYMFANNPNLTSIDLTGFNTKGSQSMSNMFANDSSLKSVDLSKLNTSLVKNMNQMFLNDTSLTDFPTIPNTSSLNTASGMFEGDTALTSADLSKWATHNLKDSSYMFKDDTSLNSINVHWTTTSQFLTDTSSMFENDSSLDSLDLSSWTLSQTSSTHISTGKMFDGTNLKSIVLGSGDRFSKDTSLPSSGADKWVNVGSGSIDKPEASISFPASSIDTLYNGTNTPKSIVTFVPRSDNVTADLEIPTNLGTKKVSVTGTPGQDVTINTPNVTDYIPDKAKITAKINTDGSVSTTDSIVYSPTNATVTISSNLGNKTVTGVSGAVGTNIQVRVPSVDNYTSDKEFVTATVNKDGSVTTTESVNYAKNITSDVTINSNKGPQTVKNVSGVSGKNTTVNVPTIKDFIPNKTSVQAEVNDEGITTTESIIYSPTNATVTIPTSLGDKTVTGVSGTVGKTININVPTVDGYTADKSTVQGKVNADGTITTSDYVEYKKNDTTQNITNDVVINSNLGKQTVKNVNGSVGQNITVDVPQIEGFKPNKNSVTATVNPDGSITTKDEVIYNPTNATLTIPTNLGDKYVKNLVGTVGNNLDVTVPDIDGYKPNKTTVLAVVNNDGTITTSDNVIYTKNTDEDTIIADVTIPSNLDYQVVKNVTGIIGKKVTVNIPDVTGYTHALKTIQADVNANGTITAPLGTKIIYLKANNSSGGSNSGYHVSIEKQNRTISTFSDRPNVTLYSWDSNHTMKQVTNRELKSGTDWFSDEMITIDGVSYYRVSSNEWVKASQVYVYDSNRAFVRTYSNSNKRLYKAEGPIITNRELSKNSDWFSDRIAYINGERYYRVATNEFVNINDAYVY